MLMGLCSFNRVRDDRRRQQIKRRRAAAAAALKEEKSEKTQQKRDSKKELPADKSVGFSLGKKLKKLNRKEV
jgi:hypothetical protein